VKERPILFSGPMVRAILEGRKTQTRRMVKPQPAIATPGCFDVTKCPYGVVGDCIWVRETWARIHDGILHKLDPEPDIRTPHGNGWSTVYRADGEPYHWSDYGVPWRPSIHMPRWASRITLEIVSIRVERLQDIREEGASAEGVDWGTRRVFAFRDLWDSIYGNWDANPWVWVVEFRRVEK